MVLVQPWYSAPGHPAQSILNLSRVVPQTAINCVLISSAGNRPALRQMAAEMAQRVPLRVFRTWSTNLRVNTLLAVVKLAFLRLGAQRRSLILFFVDCDLPLVCLLLSLGGLRQYAKVCLVHLGGPEPFTRNRLKHLLFSRALRTRPFLMFVRTADLRDSWATHYPLAKASLRVLPPIEAVAPAGWRQPQIRLAGPLRLAVIGQIRIGKYIPALLSAADLDRDSIVVAVHGPLYPGQPTEFLRTVQAHPQVRVGFMPEQTMLTTAAEHDYLSCIFEEDKWDVRMESATFWLAIRAGRPVVCNASGWVASMVHITGCGFILPRAAVDHLALREIPRRDTALYRQYCANVDILRAKLTPGALWHTLKGEIS
jgi:hypothetical protein